MQMANRRYLIARFIIETHCADIRAGQPQILVGVLQRNQESGHLLARVAPFRFWSYRSVRELLEALA